MIKLQDIIASEDSSMLVQKGIQQYVESKLIVDSDYDYRGAGYGFKIDMYSLLGKLK